ncbi:MAG: hypothetical protein ACK53K_07180 [Burkholderiales bacterium]|jgi:hypothetical protein
MNQALFRSILLSCFSTVLASCGKEPPNVELLATDIHVSVAQHNLVLPLIALEDHAKIVIYQKQSFLLQRHSPLDKSSSSHVPLVLDSVSLVVRTYGWNDFDMHQRQVCSMLTRKWAQSVCDNPWAAIQQALPRDRFRLIDLSVFKGSANCRQNDRSHPPLPQQAGQAAIVCTAMVYGSSDDEFYSAVVRISGELGAVWTVWRDEEYGETAEGMTKREGKAIAAFVKYSLGKNEDFQNLHLAMCQLRRPGSIDGPNGPDCGRIAQPIISPSLAHKAAQ